MIRYVHNSNILNLWLIALLPRKDKNRLIEEDKINNPENNLRNMLI